MKNILIVILFTLLAACSTKEMDYMELYPHLKESVIDINSGYSPYNNAAQRHKIKPNRRTILTIVDATCARCIGELKVWGKLIERHDLADDFNLIFIAQGSPNYYFNFNVLEQDFYKFPIYLDKSYLFNGDVDMIDIRAEHTAILDENNTPVFLGSPVLNIENQKPFLNALYQ